MRIGIVPISAKPYHVGHHSLVKTAAGENDQVLLFVSTSDRRRKGEVPISGSDMQRIWTEEIEKVLPKNVMVAYGGSPVQKVYSVLESAEETIQQNDSLDDIYTVYSDPEDTALNYPAKNREKYFPNAYRSGNILFAAEENPGSFTRGVGTPDVSGTAVRSSLGQCDYSTFSASLPDGVDKEKIYNILCPSAGTNEALVRQYVNCILKG